MKALPPSEFTLRHFQAATGPERTAPCIFTPWETGRSARRDLPERHAVASAGVSLLGITLTILLLGLAFCGCSQKHDAATRPAIELVQAGQDTTWADGNVLHVTKREGSSLEGIQIVKTALDGQQTLIVADKGTVSEGADQNSVKITLREVQVQKGNTQTRAHLMNVVLSK
jgi:hypothetical protein